jgi:hypothetical protein
MVTRVQPSQVPHAFSCIASGKHLEGFRFAAILMSKVCFQEDFMLNRNRRSRVRYPIYKAFVLSLLTIFSFTSTADSFAQHIFGKRSALSPANLSTSVPSTVAQQTDSGNSITGIPWAGAEGITESTADIMARDKATSPETPRQGIENHLISYDRSNLPQNSLSPNIAQFPSAQQNAAPAETHAPQIPDVSFTGATLAGTNPSGAFPPDTMGAVGPTQFVVMVNGRLVTFNKITGVADGVLNTTTDTFFASVRNGSSTIYPRVRYDRLSQRWFLLISNAATPNRILLAVSNSAMITAGTVWTFFQFQHDMVSPTGDTGCVADYATLGIDANALYIGVNVFCGTPRTFSGTTAFVVRKSSVLGAGPIVVAAFRNLTGSPGGTGLFTPQGADNYDPLATEGYFIGVDNASFGTLVVRRVTDPAGTPTLSANALITVPTTGFPITVRHQGNTGGTNGQLDALDDRLFAAHIRNGKLWTAHNIGVDNTGAAGPTRSRNGSRWYELTGLNTATPSVVQSGTLFASSATNTVDERNYWIPTVMVSGQGHMALGASIAGTSEFINAATAGRLAGDTLGTLQAPVALTTSATAYNPAGDTGATGARRWGNYSYTSLDPCDDMTMWTIQEFCDAANSYGVRAVKLLAPPPATPIAASPATIGAGQASVNVTITGNQVSGSGFYDPGTGFGCRIGAVVSGLTVNSVTYQSPTTVIVNVSTVGATNGAKDVTITNPDGQTRSGTGLVTVSGAAGCSFSINPTSQTFSASGGTGNTTITTTAGCAWNASSNASWITITSATSGTGNSTVNFTVDPNTTNAVRTGSLIVAGQTFTVTQRKKQVFFSFDGDVKSDLSVWTPSASLWRIRNSSNGIITTLSFGASTDKIVPADYDGDGKTDIATWRPSTGNWSIRNSSNSNITNTVWGGSSDVPVPSDYDGDGKADIAIWRPSSGIWFIINSSNGSMTTVGWGVSGDVPVPGDYDGDGKSDIGIWRPSAGVWFIINSSNGAVVSAGWGVNGDVPVVGDYDGDNRSDIAIWRPSAGVWFIINSSNSAVVTTGWGVSTDKAVPGDYDGDGKTDVAVWRPSNATWFIVNSSGAPPTTFTVFGTNGDIPIPSAFQP